MAAFFANLPDITEEHGRLVVRYLDRNCVDACFLPGVGFGGTMKIEPSFQKSISMNVTNWKIRRHGVHWLKTFKTVEDFLAQTPLGYDRPGLWKKGIMATASSSSAAAASSSSAVVASSSSAVAASSGRHQRRTRDCRRYSMT